MDLYLLEVKALPGAYIQDVIRRCQHAIKTGTAEGKGKVHSLYKVVGESRVIAVVEEGLATAEEQLNNCAGETIELSCSPLTHFDIFSINILKCSNVSGAGQYELAPAEGQHVFWLQVVFKQKGDISHDHFVAYWRNGTNNAFMALNRPGKKNVAIYKVTGEKKVHIFMCAASSIEVEQAMFGSGRLFKGMDRDFKVTCKKLAAF